MDETRQAEVNLWSRNLYGNTKESQSAQTFLHRLPWGLPNQKWTLLVWSAYLINWPNGEQNFEPYVLYGEWPMFLTFLSATEYHSDADYNSRRVGVVVVVVVVVVVTDFKKWITFLCFDRFGSYLVGSCTRLYILSDVCDPTNPTGPTNLPI